MLVNTARLRALAVFQRIGSPRGGSARPDPRRRSTEEYWEYGPIACTSSASIARICPSASQREARLDAVMPCLDVAGHGFQPVGDEPHRSPEEAVRRPQPPFRRHTICCLMPNPPPTSGQMIRTR